MHEIWPQFCFHIGRYKYVMCSKRDCRRVMQTEKLSAEKLSAVIINDLFELLFRKKAFQ